jgi:hypothetical protein
LPLHRDRTESSRNPGGVEKDLSEEGDAVEGHGPAIGLEVDLAAEIVKFSVDELLPGVDFSSPGSQVAGASPKAKIGILIGDSDRGQKGAIHIVKAEKKIIAAEVGELSGVFNAEEHLELEERIPAHCGIVVDRAQHGRKGSIGTVESDCGGLAQSSAEEALVNRLDS